MSICMLMLNWMFSIMLMFMNHPLSLGCILLLQTILISLMTGMFYLNFWFSYILFLVMIGGMLVMFIYMTSIASNEKFSLPKFMMLFCSSMLMLMTMMMKFTDKFYSELSNFLLTNMNQNLMVTNFSLNKFFTYPNMQMMLLLMIYLLITLIAIVKIIEKKIGPLRQK